MASTPLTLTDQLGMTEAEAADRVLQRVRRYVELETPSRDVPRILALADILEADLRAVGAHVERFEAPGLGRNLEARFPGLEPDLAPVVILGHMDTVHPAGTLESMPFEVADERVCGPGIYDMKTGVALAIEALALLVSRQSGPHRPVRLLLTCDEEIGSHSSRPLIQAAARAAAAVLVPEPSMPDGGVKTARKGVSTYRLDVQGRAAHAGIEPEQAVSATVELAHQILEILALADATRGTTINVGVIGGGTATNVVPAQAWATLDVRAWDPADNARIGAALANLRPHHPEARVHARLTEDRPPLVRSDAVARLFAHAHQQVARLGLDLGEGSTGGGSDGCITAALGTPTLDGLGPRGAGAHTSDEHILLSDLPFRLAFMTLLLETL